MAAPTIPDLTYGNTAILTVSQRVAPRLYAASLCESGTTLITSLQIEEIIGIIMIANTIPAVKMSRPNGVFAKNGSSHRKHRTMAFLSNLGPKI